MGAYGGSDAPVTLRGVHFNAHPPGVAEEEPVHGRLGEPAQLDERLDRVETRLADLLLLGLVDPGPLFDPVPQVIIEDLAEAGGADSLGRTVPARCLREIPAPNLVVDRVSCILDTMSTSTQTIDDTDAVIVARNLGKAYGSVEAVNDLSFSVEAGRIVGLLGPNGACKTTTINTLTTLVPVDRGSASIGGYDVATRPDQVRQLIGLAGQSAAVDEKLTARENLQLFSRLYKISRPDRTRRIEELIERFDMTDFADRVASTYSGGQRRRLDVVAALVADPPALFLDEPTTGLDPRSRAELWDAISDLASQGTAIVLTTQNLDEADRLADDILTIDR
ncbi:MAG: ATP-binding cassette domain-containing protein, partial [Deltaproteobacteria bacterium]|nr:ATP-binding cassette domain-containing protein [Deltaproteobacteria bacterium]